MFRPTWRKIQGDVYRVEWGDQGWETREGDPSVA